MKVRALPILAVATALLGAAQVDMVFVDQFLQRWDRFAQGDNALVPDLKRDTPRFSAELSRALRDDDARAPARAVFYAVVQVGGSIPVESELGAALRPLLGPDFPTVTSEGKPPGFFAADLYFWLLESGSRYQSFALFDEWRERDFARATVIPMYEKVRSEPSTP